jgi:prepilin-type processing-associated H-X9-DG protein
MQKLLLRFNGRCSVQRQGAVAFTRVEVLAVVATVAMLGITFLPALATSPSAGQNAACRENTRQLARALLLYSADYTDFLPPNPDDGNTTPFHAWVPGQSGKGAPQEFNPDILTDGTRSLLFRYIDGGVEVFRCPSDLRTGRYQGTNQEWRAAGKIVPAARSYAMNLAAGTEPWLSRGKRPVNGAWLDGKYNHTANKTWFTFGKTTDMKNPGPARTWLFLDEDPASINDCVFSLVGPYPGKQDYSMIDWPATFHDYGANLAFADGHAESHSWLDPRTGVKNGNVSRVLQPGNVDIEWMSTHATALVRQPQLAVVGSVEPNGFRLTTRAVKGAQYTLESSDSLSSTNWKTVSQMTATNSGYLEFTDPEATNTQQYYRAWTP